jgi:hypothetical protein
LQSWFAVEAREDEADALIPANAQRLLARRDSAFVQ